MSTISSGVPLSGGLDAVSKGIKDVTDSEFDPEVLSQLTDITTDSQEGWKDVVEQAKQLVVQARLSREAQDSANLSAIAVHLTAAGGIYQSALANPTALACTEEILNKASGSMQRAADAMAIERDFLLVAATGCYVPLLRVVQQLQGASETFASAVSAPQLKEVFEKMTTTGTALRTLCEALSAGDDADRSARELSRWLKSRARTLIDWIIELSDSFISTGRGDAVDLVRALRPDLDKSRYSLVLDYEVVQGDRLPFLSSNDIAAKTRQARMDCSAAEKKVALIAEAIDKWTTAGAVLREEETTIAAALADAVANAMKVTEFAVQCSETRETFLEALIKRTDTKVAYIKRLIDLVQRSQRRVDAFTPSKPSIVKKQPTKNNKSSTLSTTVVESVPAANTAIIAGASADADVPIAKKGWSIIRDKLKTQTKSRSIDEGATMSLEDSRSRALTEQSTGQIRELAEAELKCCTLYAKLAIAQLFNAFNGIILHVLTSIKMILLSKTAAEDHRILCLEAVLSGFEDTNSFSEEQTTVLTNTLSDIRDSLGNDGNIALSEALCVRIRTALQSVMRDDSYAFVQEFEDLVKSFSCREQGDQDEVSFLQDEVGFLFEGATTDLRYKRFKEAETNLTTALSKIDLQIKKISEGPHDGSMVSDGLNVLSEVLHQRKNNGSEAPKLTRVGTSVTAWMPRLEWIADGTGWPYSGVITTCNADGLYNIRRYPVNSIGSPSHDEILDECNVSMARLIVDAGGSMADSIVSGDAKNKTIDAALPIDKCNISFEGDRKADVFIVDVSSVQLRVEVLRADVDKSVKQTGRILRQYKDYKFDVVLDPVLGNDEKEKVWGREAGDNLRPLLAKNAKSRPLCRVDIHENSPVSARYSKPGLWVPGTFVNAVLDKKKVVKSWLVNTSDNAERSINQLGSIRKVLHVNMEQMESAKGQVDFQMPNSPQQWSRGVLVGFYDKDHVLLHEKIGSLARYFAVAVSGPSREGSIERIPVSNIEARDGQQGSTITGATKDDTVPSTTKKAGTEGFFSPFKTMVKGAVSLTTEDVVASDSLALIPVSNSYVAPSLTAAIPRATIDLKAEIIRSLAVACRGQGPSRCTDASQHLYDLLCLYVELLPAMEWQQSLVIILELLEACLIESGHDNCLKLAATVNEQTAIIAVCLTVNAEDKTPLQVGDLIEVNCDNGRWKGGKIIKN